MSSAYESQPRQLTPDQQAVLLDTTHQLIRAGIAGKYNRQLSDTMADKEKGRRPIGASLDELSIAHMAELPFAISVFYSEDNETHEYCRGVNIIKVDLNGLKVSGSNVHAGMIEEETLDIREVWGEFDKDDVQLLLDRWQAQEAAELSDAPFSM